MSNGRKAMLEICKMKMTPALSAEHQRKWDESRWECKLDDPERNYDKSRVHLNFEIRKGAVITPIDKTVCIKDKVTNVLQNGRQNDLPKQTLNQSSEALSTNRSALSWGGTENE